MASKHLNSISLDHQVQIRTGIPSDYHCTCEYCKNFMGEIYNVDQDKYYSNRIRKEYYLDKAGEHLDVGQIIGYRWAVQNLCPENGYVLDPTAGTGTAIVESIINKRNAIGVELEYPEIGQKNIRYAIELMGNTIDQTFRFRQGDATKIDEYMSEWGFDEPFLDLIINGTPYPKLSSKSSDAPERKNLQTKEDKSFDYTHEDNIGLTKGNIYWNLIDTMYSKSIKYLKPGGYFVILIKDLVQDKKPYLLHKYITDVVLDHNPDMEHYGFFLHKHCPTTMFINTYTKRFPGLLIPLYQTGIVLRKKEFGLGEGFPREIERTVREIITEIKEKKITTKFKKDKTIIKPSSNISDIQNEVKWQEGYNFALNEIEIKINELKKSQF
ncbi:MAG: hypothetical protein PHF86_02500 [Candidatus Nanoarchaeia archaeon]|nr:hypothetical protein [Candidatus Nanoarchaeia archaeon]